MKEKTKSTSEIPNYNHSNIESKWYKYWEKNDYFKPSGNKEPYCIMLPPPNVTGSLHMGHGFQCTLMDILIRYHRMQGRQTLWQVGTDHAGIATQMVVERNLAQEGITKDSLGRDKFIDKIWEWKSTSGNRITQQLREIGASVDWSKERFTLDKELSAAVEHVFIELYNEGLLYRGQRLVNWDPKLLTAISDLEVISQEENGKLWTIKYLLKNDNNYIEIATTRPETMLGDVAIAVNPNDIRYQHLKGKTAIVPICNREIPIIFDDMVEKDFGTGAVKITPAHDFNDYKIGKKHKLDPINIFNKDASLNKNTPSNYQGLDRFVARKKILDELKNLSQLSKEIEHKLTIPKGDRSGVIVEPMLTDQWFIKAKPLAKNAIEVVKSGKIKFIPKNWENTYFQWLENIEDWCISRQLWWGHRIPAWYDVDGKYYVGKTKEAVIKQHNLPENILLTQDQDVLDTWFSSALWPFSTLGWPENTKELEKFYPTQVLVTGFDIIFFWVARMIMMGLKFTDQIPFKEIYITGLIRDFHGKKMSKSKGNIIDPLDIIHGISLQDLQSKRTKGLMQPKQAEHIKTLTQKDFPNGIESHGCDALRYTFCALANTGTNINFDLNRLAGYRNFCNKLWNAARFVMLQAKEYSFTNSISPKNDIDKWILSKLQKTIQETHKQLSTYRFDLYSQILHEFAWHEYCDWYLELSKTILYSETSNETKTSTIHTLLIVLENILCLLHPVIPYITEEIWQWLREKLNIENPSIMIREFPTCNTSLINSNIEHEMKFFKEIVFAIRNIRGEMNIPMNKKMHLRVFSSNKDTLQLLSKFEEYIINLAKISHITILNAKDTDTNSTSSQIDDLIISIAFDGLINKDSEINRITKQLKKIKLEKQKLQYKLEQTKFCQQAPENIVKQEKGKLESIVKKEQQLNLQKTKIENL